MNSKSKSKLKTMKKIQRICGLIVLLLTITGIEGYSQCGPRRHHRRGGVVFIAPSPVIITPAPAPVVVLPPPAVVVRTMHRRIYYRRRW